jgi:hypothetical protein
MKPLVRTPSKRVGQPQISSPQIDQSPAVADVFSQSDNRLVIGLPTALGSRQPSTDAQERSHGLDWLITSTGGFGRNLAD